MFCRLRNILNQLCQVGRYTFNFFQGRTGTVGQLSTFNHLCGCLLHRTYRFIGIRLNSFYQAGNLFSRCGRAFRKSLNLIRYNRETPSGFTGHRCLNGRVKCENIGLVGNLINQRNYIANFL